MVEEKGRELESVVSEAVRRTLTEIQKDQIGQRIESARKHAAIRKIKGGYLVNDGYGPMGLEEEYFPTLEAAFECIKARME